MNVVCSFWAQLIIFFMDNDRVPLVISEVFFGINHSFTPLLCCSSCGKHGGHTSGFFCSELCDVLTGGKCLQWWAGRCTQQPKKKQKKTCACTHEPICAPIKPPNDAHTHAHLPPPPVNTHAGVTTTRHVVCLKRYSDRELATRVYQGTVNAQGHLRTELMGEKSDKTNAVV